MTLCRPIEVPYGIPLRPVFEGKAEVLKAIMITRLLINVTIVIIVMATSVGRKIAIFSLRILTPHRVATI